MENPIVMPILSFQHYVILGVINVVHSPTHLWWGWFIYPSVIVISLLVHPPPSTDDGGVGSYARTLPAWET